MLYSASPCSFFLTMPHTASPCLSPCLSPILTLPLILPHSSLQASTYITTLPIPPLSHTLPTPTPLPSSSSGSLPSALYFVWPASLLTPYYYYY
ncbi:hypothetical protein Pcinc_034780 [Petrolisthes cinctipes]|uniref:Uncharacterized protein n=1 Tax=Petrolisthes cinctipes TaxID=88211 RepID=A0AAE1BXW6_PETCI|nr:hypothetical protein Pcinc_034780 [Petrolisthes cinctipes]